MQVTPPLPAAAAALLTPPLPALGAAFPAPRPVAAVDEAVIETLRVQLSAELLRALFATNQRAAENHFSRALAAARDGDIMRLLAQLELSVAEDPSYASRATADPQLRPYLSDIVRLLARVRATEQMVVEDRIHRAQAIPDPPPEAKVLLALARTASDSNGYPDLHFAARAARLALEAYAPAEQPAPPAEPAFASRAAIWNAVPLLAAAARAGSRLRALWRRYPLLLLFLGWLTVGLPAALFFRPYLRWWGVGFLLLTTLGFLISAALSMGTRPGSARSRAAR